MINQTIGWHENRRRHGRAVWRRVASPSQPERRCWAGEVSARCSQRHGAAAWGDCLTGGGGISDGTGQCVCGVWFTMNNDLAMVRADDGGQQARGKVHMAA